jgi:hypothetical protein
VDLRASRYADLQYHVCFRDKPRIVRTRNAWKDGLLNHVTVRDGQAVSGHWVVIDGHDWLNLGPGAVPKAFEHLGVRVPSA